MNFIRCGLVPQLFFTQKQASAILFLPYHLSYTILTKFFENRIANITVKIFFGKKGGAKCIKLNFLNMMMM